jgi:hypothetical protein
LNVVGRLNFDPFGQPVIAANVSVLGRRTVPAPRTLSTLLAANADSARIDAALVRVVNVNVDSVLTPDVLRVNDGSGTLEVILDRDSGTYPTVAQGARLDVTGVLIPIAAGRWALKPRESTDLVVR